MAKFKYLTAQAAAAMLDQEKVQVVDIRDSGSYKSGHIAGAIHLSDDNVKAFILATDKTLPVIVCCYHGNSSQGAAQFLVDQGFDHAYSLEGGFEQWRSLFPHVCQ